MTSFTQNKNDVAQINSAKSLYSLSILYHCIHILQSLHHSLDKKNKITFYAGRQRASKNYIVSIRVEENRLFTHFEDKPRDSVQGLHTSHEREKISGKN